LAQIQVFLRFDDAFQFGLIRPLVGLCPGAVHGRAFAAVQQAELDARGVDGLPHRSAQRIDLADDMALGHASDRRIATHLRHGVRIRRQQGRASAHPGCGQRRFGAGVTGPDNDHIVFVMADGHHRQRNRHNNRLASFEHEAYVTAVLARARASRNPRLRMSRSIGE